MDEENVESFEKADEATGEQTIAKDPHGKLKLALSAVIAVLMFICGYFVGAAVGNDVENIVNPNPKPHTTSTESESPVDSIELKISETFPIPLENVDETGVITEVRDGVIYYYTGGSSTCQPLIEKASVKDDGTFVLEVIRYPNQMCTSDYSTFGQTIERVDGEPIPDDAVVEVR